MGIDTLTIQNFKKCADRTGYHLVRKRLQRP
jgi:hypothetical protein